MCIRDRFYTDQLDEQDVRKLREGTGSGPVSRQHQGPVSSPCLLYTSDAADERSSVDLGGRRIIKKKTELHDVRDRVHREKQLLHDTTTHTNR